MAFNFQKLATSIRGICFCGQNILMGSERRGGINTIWSTKPSSPLRAKAPTKFHSFFFSTFGGGSGNHSIQERISLMNYSSPHPRWEASPETVATYFADVLQETVCCSVPVPASGLGKCLGADQTSNICQPTLIPMLLYSSHRVQTSWRTS